MGADAGEGESAEGQRDRGGEGEAIIIIRAPFLSCVSYARAARSYSWGNHDDDGVNTNVERVRLLLDEEGILPVSSPRPI